MPTLISVLKSTKFSIAAMNSEVPSTVFTVVLSTSLSAVAASRESLLPVDPTRPDHC